MDRTELIIHYATILSLVICLLLWLLNKVMGRLAPRNPRYWSGHAFDVKSLEPRIKNVRENFVANLHQKGSASARRDRVSCARRAPGHLAYFRERGADVDGSLND
jgi:hypothetical protein